MPLGRFGPVFVYESVAAARRRQTYAVRAGFLAILLISLTIVWATKLAGMPATISKMAQVGASFFYAIVGTQLALVLLAAPAFTAGAICLDRARGTLAHMLVTDLSATEIVLGKLGARLLPVLGLVIAGLPILALAILLGGIDPNGLIGGFLVTLGVAIAGCSLALALSVWGNKPHEVLLGTYIVWVLVLLAWPAWQLLPASWAIGPAPAWLEESNPFWLAFAPYLRSGGVPFEDYLYFLGACVAVSALLVSLAAVTLRRTAMRETVRKRRRRGGILGWHWPRIGPSLDFNPVLWRELHGRRPSRWIRVLWIIYFLGSLAATVLALIARGAGGPGGDMMPFVNAFVYSLGLLLVSVTSVTSLFEERVRGSLDVLMATPLSTASIVQGKWWGAFRSALIVMLLPLGSALFLGVLGAWPETKPTERWEGPTVCLLPVLFVYGPMGMFMFLGWLTKDRNHTWWACWRIYRQGLLLLPLVVATAVCVGLMKEESAATTLLLAILMLAYGSAVTSLGLALATWIKRFSVALGLSVGIYVLVAGASMLVFVAVGPPSVDNRGIAFVSPWYAAGELTFEVGERFGGGHEPVGWKIAWGVVYAVAALVLLIKTHKTFDRCMGRVTERGHRKVRYYVRQ